MPYGPILRSLGAFCGSIRDHDSSGSVSRLVGGLLMWEPRLFLAALFAACRNSVNSFCGLAASQIYSGPSKRRTFGDRKSRPDSDSHKGFALTH